ncbi:hypothetical protein CEUSTIGMA_g11943.t1 [Chlamydomonas eustigma]|uniref:Uncharacterized protein n=1 Tax=Chlamydomonas eustigma TaxID=1157962 RepID=A0A250XNN9_9CHLO|nr:hypothetical protein CEUSTIGMA_g11943.t1 [Chlamydomonas eustigma]|eukprot:GAX84522.1 hypothetical protein CEUSTIGMA_g11943.t1 [Chlamydomonas eustigma]
MSVYDSTVSHVDLHARRTAAVRPRRRRRRDQRGAGIHERRAAPTTAVVGLRRTLAAANDATSPADDASASPTNDATTSPTDDATTSPTDDASPTDATSTASSTTASSATDDATATTDATTATTDAAADTAPSASDASERWLSTAAAGRGGGADGMAVVEYSALNSRFKRNIHARSSTMSTSNSTTPTSNSAPPRIFQIGSDELDRGGPDSVLSVISVACELLGLTAETRQAADEAHRTIQGSGGFALSRKRKSRKVMEPGARAAACIYAAVTRQVLDVSREEIAVKCGTTVRLMVDDDAYTKLYPDLSEVRRDYERIRKSGKTICIVPEWNAQLSDVARQSIRTLQEEHHASTDSMSLALGIVHTLCGVRHQ